MRWILLDQVLKIEKGKRAQTQSRVPASEYSAEPLILEMMAQTAGMLLGAESDFESNVVFAKIESAEFRKPFLPHEPLLIEAHSESLKPEGAWMDANVYMQGEVAACSRLLLMSVDALGPGCKGSLTFHKDFMNHFQILSKVQ